MNTKRLIQHAIIHCTATPNGRPVSLADVDFWHGKDRENRGLHPFQRNANAIAKFNPTCQHIGYHHIITTYGGFLNGRAIEEVGAHCLDYNHTSIGIAMAGDDKYTVAQWGVLRAYCRGLIRQYPEIKIIGHNEVSEKSCPGFDVQAWLRADMQTLKNHILESNK